MDRDEHFANFERDGETAVRENIDHERYAPRSAKMVFAKEWLRLRIEARSNAAIQKTEHIARSAKNAAWASAVISAIALAVAVIALLMP